LRRAAAYGSLVLLSWSRLVALSLVLLGGGCGPEPGVPGDTSIDPETDSETGEDSDSIWPEGPIKLVPWQELVFLRAHEGRTMLMTVARDGSGLGPIYDGGGAPLVSGDGRHILWSGVGELLLLSEGSSSPTALERLERPVWAPKGAVLAAVNINSLEVIDIDQGTSVTLVLHVSTLSEPVWSPSGKKLAYEDGGALWVAEVDTGVVESVISPVSNTSLAWSPDESTLAMGMDGRVVLVDLESGSTAPVIELTVFDGAGPPYVRWSPDGQWIGWKDRHGLTSGGFVRPGGTDSQWLWDWLEGPPAWSPSTRWLSFLGSTHGHDCFGGDCADLRIYSPDFEESRYLQRPRQMAWAPDEEFLVVSSDRFEDDEKTGERIELPWRVGVFDVELDTLKTVGDLAEDDPRADSHAVWRRMSGE